MASKGFSFIKKKEDTSHLQEPTILPQNTSEIPFNKKGFSFIKKHQSQNNQLPISQLIEEKPKTSLESLFTNDLLLNIIDKGEETQLYNFKNNIDNINPKKELDAFFSQEEVKQSHNDTIDLSNNNHINIDAPSPKVSSSSGSSKPKFSFIKKDKSMSNDNLNENVNTNISIKQTDPINKPFNINNQYDDNYEFHLFTNDKSEGSVSSKKTPAIETINKNMMSPKDSSKHSSLMGNMSEKINHNFGASEFPINQKEIPNLIKELKADEQIKPIPKLTVQLTY